MCVYRTDSPESIDMCAAVAERLGEMSASSEERHLPQTTETVEAAMMLESLLAPTAEEGVYCRAHSLRLRHL